MKEARERMTQQGYKEYRPTGLGRINTAWPASIIPEVAGLNTEICVEVCTTKDMVYESYRGRVEKHYPYRFKLTVKGKHSDEDGYTESSPECWIKSFGDEEPFYEICIPYHSVHSIEVLDVEEKETTQEDLQEGMWAMWPGDPTDYRLIVAKTDNPHGILQHVIRGQERDSNAQRIVEAHNEIVQKLKNRTVWQVLKDSGLQITMNKNGIQVGDKNTVSFKGITMRLPDNAFRMYVTGDSTARWRTPDGIVVEIRDEGAEVISNEE